MKITVVGSHLCPDTLYALNKLSAAGAEVSFQDILSCHAALQTYLHIRETSDLYAEMHSVRQELPAPKRPTPAACWRQTTAK